jgi:plastocyanin
LALVTRFAAVAVLAVLVAAPAANAADQQITAAIGTNTFSPNEVTVGIGDTVTVSRAAGGSQAHNVHYADLSTGCPASPITSAWSCPRTFTSLGNFPFKCDQHASMTGTVHVVANPPGPGPGPGPGPPGDGGTSNPASFGTSTLVTLALASKRIPARGPLSLRVENANGFAVTGSLSGETTKPVSLTQRKRRVKLRAKTFQVSANAQTTVKLRLPTALRRLLQRKRKLSMRLTASLKDPPGNIRTVTKNVTPRLKKKARH